MEKLSPFPVLNRYEGAMHNWVFISIQGTVFTTEKYISMLGTASDEGFTHTVPMRSKFSMHFLVIVS